MRLPGAGPGVVRRTLVEHAHLGGECPIWNGVLICDPTWAREHVGYSATGGMVVSVTNRLTDAEREDRDE